VFKNKNTNKKYKQKIQTKINLQKKLFLNVILLLLE